MAALYHSVGPDASIYSRVSDDHLNPDSLYAEIDCDREESSWGMSEEYDVHDNQVDIKFYT